MNDFVIKAAQNNAEWCDIVCRIHGVPGEFLENIWINQQEVPTLLYPNAVTIKPLSNTTLDEIIHTLKEIPLKSYAIKDSFNELSPDKLDSKILFEADWIMIDNKELIHPTTTSDWTIIKDEKELENWEDAWNSDQSIGQRIFLPSILSEKGVFFLAKYKDDQIVAGGIINISRDVIGLSNVFTSEHSISNPWNEISVFAKEKISTLPCVGYERDNDLVQALEAGFKTIGRLKVLLKS